MKNTKSGFIGIVLAIVTAIAILSFGGYEAYQNHEMKVREQTDNSSIASSNDTDMQYAPIPSSNQLSSSYNANFGWKTYVNSQYGYSFTYPSSAQISETNTGSFKGVDVKLDAGNFNVRIQNKADFKIDSATEAYNYSATDNRFTKDDSIGNLNQSMCPPTYSLAELNSYVVGLSGLYTARGNEDTQYAILTNKDYVILIDFTDTNKAKTGEVYQVLNSFKLNVGVTSTIASCSDVSINVNTSGWKTYDPGRGFTFKYPDNFVWDQSYVYPHAVFNYTELSPDLVHSGIDLVFISFSSSVGDDGPQGTSVTLGSQTWTKTDQIGLLPNGQYARNITYGIYGAGNEVFTLTIIASNKADLTGKEPQGIIDVYEQVVSSFKQ